MSLFPTLRRRDAAAAIASPTGVPGSRGGATGRRDGTCGHAGADRPPTP